MPPKERHILFLPRWYPNKYDPMFGLFIQHHAYVAALNHKISVVYVHFCNEEKDVEFQVKQDNILEISIYILRSINPILNLFNWLKAYYKGIGKAIDINGNINLTHVHILTRLGVIAYFLNTFKSIPFVITEHWSRYQEGRDFKGFFRKLATKIVAKKAKGLTTPSRHLQSAMLKHGIQANYSVLSNTVSEKLFFPDNHAGNPVFHILHISCFEEASKNMSGILKAMQELKKHAKFKLSMIGTGMDFNQTLKLAKELDLLDVVDFPGMLQGEELASKVRKADLLIMFSNYENMPVVISEALCCGIPVVSSNVGGIKEILHPDFGILVPKNDQSAFVQAILQVMKNPDFYHKDKIASMASKIWHEKAVSEQLENLYTNAF